MASAANVQSLERLEEFLRQLGLFQEKLSKHLDDLRIEINRVDHWMTTGCPGYWQEQERLAKRRWTEARERLLQCQSTIRPDARPSCSEHRKRLEKCTIRVALCEKRLRQIKQCQILWQQLEMQLKLKMQHVVDVAEARLPQARFHLDASLEPLRQYARMTNAAAEPTKPASSSDSGTTS
jgi:hypothetical protein